MVQGKEEKEQTMSNEEVMIPKSYHDKVCEEIIRFKDKQFYDAVHLLDDGTLEITVEDYTKVKRVLVEDDNNFGNLFYEDEVGRPQEWIPCSEMLPSDYNDYLVVDGDGEMAVGCYRGDADAWDNSCFGWLEREDEDEHPTRLGKVVAWMPLPKPWKGADDD